jgi:AraC-like DNA-binding protein
VEYFARLRQYRAARGAFDQPYSHLSLQTLDRFGHGRLGNAELFGRACQRTGARDGQEISQVSIDLSPAQYALWIPPYTEHVSFAHGETIYRSAYVSLACSARMPVHACIVNVGPVLRAVLDNLAARDIRTPETDADRHLAQVVLDMILDADNHVQHYLPHAASAGLNRVLASLHECPGDRRTTAEIAAAVHMTARTLERKCQRELGMTLNDWRQRLKLTHAIERLAAGDTVQHIAITLGYGTSSAFIAMFRRVVGTTPEQYRKNAGE